MPWPERIAGWAAEHAPGRLFGGSEVAAAFSIPPSTAKHYLSRAVARGLLVRWRRDAFSLPAAGPFTDDVSWAGRITDWAARHAPDRTFSTGDVAAAFGIPEHSAQSYLSQAVTAGRLVRWRPGAFAVPGAGPFDPAPPTAADRIVAFIAADGGGTWQEIRAGTGIPGDTLCCQLTLLARSGRLVRLDEPARRRRRFYLLPGQEPGQVTDPAVTVPARPRGGR